MEICITEMMRPNSIQSARISGKVSDKKNSCGGCLSRFYKLSYSTSHIHRHAEWLVVVVAKIGICKWYQWTLVMTISSWQLPIHTYVPLNSSHSHAHTKKKKQARICASGQNRVCAVLSNNIFRFLFSSHSFVSCAFFLYIQLIFD